MRRFIEQLGHEIPEDVKKRILNHSSERTGEDGIDKSIETIIDMEMETENEYGVQRRQ